MIYVTSDLHGYPLSDLIALLDRVGFSDEDFLFVLGDVIDRGDHGLDLLRWMAEQPNVQLLLGNHEAMLLECDFVFEDLTEEFLTRLTAQKMDALSNWMANGAAPTLSALRGLQTYQPQRLEGILDYLQNAPLYDTVEAGGRTYVLVHAGLGGFDPRRPLDEYTLRELLWARPTLDTRYYEDATVVFGHTPTGYFDSAYAGRVLRSDTWICVDAGVVGGHGPALLRLDDLQEFYGEADG